VRRWVIGGLVVVVLVGAGVLVWLLRYRTDTKVTPVGVDAAVADFQQRRRGSLPDSVASDPPAATTADDTDASAVLPEPGVYVYATTGGDGVDALGGASHDYPALTTLTVTEAGCGVAQQWVAAEERFDQFLTCATPDGTGVDLAAFTEFHEFFGISERDDFLCSGDPRPLVAEAGTTWTVVCARSGEHSTWSGRVLAPETITVDGTDVATDHVVWEIDNGDDRDRQRTETWYLAGTDLVVKRVIDNHTIEGSVVGDVTYTESAELLLQSLTPSR
jgi:hypothetical protein